ncbi:NAD(P)/FAD-dependent oxidoreductase [Paenibacillus sp. UNC499MF]|uniref:phytoene desaturase family protein n=1 Tax=Paenibacillus sp. UNC499MF TaxID=1502751 RepID=UPI00089FAA1F|nr:phytoene desaturase family protein [Paenibacillus sp. UNC499MF]SEG05657.1 phytoene desaturase [Paenibacillus sp. UNC499MF]
MNRTPEGVIIGGGIGGLVASIKLASLGYKITLLEKNASLGGKLQAHAYGPYSFDFGPSTMTMPWVFKRLYTECGEQQDPALQFIKLDVNSRNFFRDGSVIDLSADPHFMEEQLKSFSARSRQGFKNYLREVERIYQIAERQFFSRSFTKWSDYVSPALGISLLGVRPFTTMNKFHETFFDDPRLLAMMNRYATYVGSSPYRTPATLSMIAYLELLKGVYYVQGGNYKLIEALERLARKKGVDIRTSIPVGHISVRGGKVQGVETPGGFVPASFVVSNNDYYATQLNLIPEEFRSIPGSIFLGQTSTSLSSSGFLMLLGVRKTFPRLHHHNLFFPDRYETEFTDLFEGEVWPRNPALYVCNSSYTEPQRARQGGGSNLYILANVPAAVPGRLGSHPSELASVADLYRSRLTGLLERQWGLQGLSANTEVERVFHPGDIAEISGSMYGALYGRASHGLKPTFFRPSIADRRIEGLYYAGGTTHPGGGTPMVALSGMLAAEAVSRNYPVLEGYARSDESS